MQMAIFLSVALFVHHIVSTETSDMTQTPRRVGGFGSRRDDDDADDDDDDGGLDANESAVAVALFVFFPDVLIVSRGRNSRPHLWSSHAARGILRMVRAMRVHSVCIYVYQYVYIYIHINIHR